MLFKLFGCLANYTEMLFLICFIFIVFFHSLILFSVSSIFKLHLSHNLSFVQSLSQLQLFVTPWNVALQASLSFTVSWSLLKLMLIELVMPSNHLVLCHTILLLPSIFPSIRVLSNELALHIRWPNYWSFSFSISPSNKYSGLISFRIDWFDLLEVQASLKSLLQHHSSKASILQCSAFFIVRLSHPYDPTSPSKSIWLLKVKVKSLSHV